MSKFKSHLDNLRREFFWWPFFIAFFTIAFDQWTKIATVAASGDRPGVILKVIVEGWFNFVDVRNPGAAWGMFGNHTLVLSFVSLIFGIYVLYDWKKLCEGRNVNRVAMALLLGGVLGNWIDRFFRREVVDMIDVYLPLPQFLDASWLPIVDGKYHFPAFNIADSAIFIAVAIYLIASFKAPKAPQKTSGEEKVDKEASDASSVD